MSGMISRAERISIFTEFANALRISGYDQKFRSDIIGGVLKRIKEIEHEIEKVRKSWQHPKVASKMSFKNL